MQLTNIHPLPIIVLLMAAALAVFMHDSQLDNAANIALSTPTVASEYVVSQDKFILHEQRAHFEGGVTGDFNELKPQLAVTQPLNKDEKKYVAKRRLMGSAFDKEYSWPLV